MIFIKKICTICKQERKFVKDSERDRQGICGNCFDWDVEAQKWPQCPRCQLHINPEILKTVVTDGNKNDRNGNADTGSAGLVENGTASEEPSKGRTP